MKSILFPHIATNETMAILSNTFSHLYASVGTTVRNSEAFLAKFGRGRILVDVNMSIPFSGSFTRSKGIIDAINKQLTLLTLKPVERISIKFDPFGNKASDIRNFLFHITKPKVRQTNPNCIVKTEITNDRSEPKVEFKLNNSEKVVFKSGNLTTLELLQLYNKYISTLAPPEEPTTSVATKAIKKSVKRQ